MASKSQAFKRTLFSIVLLCMLSSCSIFRESVVDSPKREFGDMLSTQLKETNGLSNEQIRDVFAKTRGFSDERKFVLANREDLLLLLRDYNKSSDLFITVERLSEQYPEKAVSFLALSLTLFPIQRHRLLEDLESSEILLHDTVENAVLLSGLDPSTFFPPSAAPEEAISITPLIHSASLTLYGFEEETTNTVSFKAENDNNWQEGYTLQWDPINGALSGSLVYLDANTSYDVVVTTFTNDMTPLEQFELSFTTRQNEVPIDPDKIYYLSDLYNGGPFDLDAFDIRGTEEGWAKIIGDGVIVDAGELADAAFDIGSTAYLVLENITIKGGKRFGLHSDNAHHIWIKGCDISEFGRRAYEYRDGKAYESADATRPINYDAGIFLKKTGVVVIENCEVHSPNLGANNWGDGHPNGPSAMLVSANHPDRDHQGQYIVRHNKFFGTKEKRFNDVVESRSNVRYHGGFIRDSAIHDNYFAFANDDIIELDGSQQNVLLYNNVMTQAYCGVSVAPNMSGPSYIFNNDIIDLGDDRGKEWTAIKMGGLFAAPAGKTLVFQNYIDVSAHGIGTGGIQGDATYWTESKNNIIRLSSYREGKRGYGVYDTEGYYMNVYSNNAILNLISDDYEVFINGVPNEISEYVVTANEKALFRNGELRDLRLTQEKQLPNFTVNYLPTEILSARNTAVNINTTNLLSFANQDLNPIVQSDSDSIFLSGNSWKVLNLDFPLNSDSILSFDLKIEGTAEIIGIALENDNALTEERVIKIDGTQKFGKGLKNGVNERPVNVILRVGDYVKGEVNRIVFVLDNDNSGKQRATATFSNVKADSVAAALPNGFFETEQSSEEEGKIIVGAYRHLSPDLSL